MNTKIEFSDEVKFGEVVVDTIEVEPLNFVTMVKLWTKASELDSSQEVVLQRSRIATQVHFLANKKRVVPDHAQLAQLPIRVAKSILNALDLEQGLPGKIVIAGDGVSKPIVYQLGQPIELKVGNEATSIKELEFLASTYGELENVLAATTELERTEILLRTVAKPLGVELSLLPMWAVDKITPADGITIMRDIIPSF